MSSQQVQAIIDALKHAAGYGWTTLVQQQVVIGIEGIIWCSVLILIGVGCLIGAKKVWPRFSKSLESAKDNYHGEWSATSCWLCGLVAVLIVAGATLVLTGSLLIVDAIGHLLNPAGYALTSLLPH